MDGYGTLTGKRLAMAQLRISPGDGQSIRPEHAEVVKAGLEDAEKAFLDAYDKDKTHRTSSD